jgi:hypothetical protein
MPPLSLLALRYVAWFIGLTVIYGILVNFAGLPPSLATGVILASAPAADVGMQATRRATRALVLQDWVKIWGVCMAVYLLLTVIGPMVLSSVLPTVREGIGGSGIPQNAALLVATTAPMMALFLWIGQRSAGGRRAS